MKELPKRVYAGADVSKDKLDVFHPNWKRGRTIANTPVEVRKIIGALQRENGICQVIVEATGGYERLLVKACQKAGQAVSVINPRQARDFAKAKGILAKTDVIDAGVLAEFGEAIKPRETRPADPGQEQLLDVSRHRAALVQQLTREKVRLEKARNGFVRKEIGGMIRLLERRIVKVTAHIAKIIGSDETMAAKSRRLEQIVGVGPVLSSTALAEMPELGTLGDKEAASLGGLAPFTRQSGRWEGRRMVSGGRGRLRRALYMPALSAKRHNPVLREFYNGLIARGKAHHVAITAVMRKLLVLLNRMLADPSFQPS